MGKVSGVEVDLDRDLGSGGRVSGVGVDLDRDLGGFGAEAIGRHVQLRVVGCHWRRKSRDRYRRLRS